MFGLGPATRVYVGLEAVDMRKGFEGLAGLVRDYLGQDPLSGHLFLFSNRGRTIPVAGGGRGGTPGHDAARAIDAFVERNGLDESEFARELVPAIKLETSAAGYR